jgi:hypothetical protein
VEREVNKRLVRQLRNAWKQRYGGEAPAKTHGTWGLTRLWAKIGSKKQEHDFGVRLDYERSERRLMKRQHLHPEPEGRTLDRLEAMAVRAFRPKKRTRASNRQARARQRPRVI